MDFAMKMVLPRLVEYVKAEKKKGTFSIEASENDTAYNISIVLPKAGGAVTPELYAEVKRMLDVN
jgi:hypothetical protein